jgi:hypothetical protein
LEGEWQHIKTCEGCKEIVTVGQRCADRDCLTRIHDICHDRVWPSQADKKCPKCKKVWEGKHFVGERAVTATQAYKKGRRRGGERRSNLAEAIIAQEEGEEEVEEEAEAGDDDGEMEE